MTSNSLSRAYVVGYYGMRNSGDDALTAATTYGLRKWHGVDEIELSSPTELKLYDGSTFRANLREKQTFPGHNRLLNYVRAIDSNRIVFGGGSVFHNARDIDLKRDMMALSGGRNHLALGVGLGPFVNTKAERSCARFLNECEFTGVRDPLSYEIARAIAPHANVELTFDLAPQLLSIDGFHLQSTERRGIAVCLCPLERLSGNAELERARLKELANALDTIQYFTGETIYFVDFNGHPLLGDQQVHEDLAAHLPEHSRFRFVRYDANPLRVLQRMATFKLAISMRLHASVFGYLSQTPVVSLNYHRKCQQWCEQIGHANSQQFDVNDLDPNELVNAVCMGIADGFELPTLSVDNALRNSMKNWRMSYESINESNIQCHYSAL